MEGYQWTPNLVNEAWKACIDGGAISGDLNHDGDVDDSGEAEILSYCKVFDILDLPLKEVPLDLIVWPLIEINGVWRIAPLKEPASLKWWILEKWVWKIGHFVQGDGTGLHAPIYDSIAGGSLTRKNGHIESIRAFAIKGE